MMRVLREKLRLSLIAVGLLALQSCLAAGCKITLTGGGELSVGMRNDNFLVFRSTIDGDKEGKEAKSELDIDPVLKSLIGGNIPESEDNDNEATGETDITD